MSIADILAHAKAHHVTVTLRDGKLKVSGHNLAVTRLLPILQPHKSDIMTYLTQAATTRQTLTLSTPLDESRHYAGHNTPAQRAWFEGLNAETQAATRRHYAQWQHHLFGLITAWCDAIKCSSADRRHQMAEAQVVGCEAMHQRIGLYQGLLASLKHRP